MKKHKKFFMVARFLNLSIISLLLTSLAAAPLVLNTPVAMANTNNYSHNHYYSQNLWSNSGRYTTSASTATSNSTATTVPVAGSVPSTSGGQAATSTFTSIAVLSSAYTITVGSTSLFTAEPKDQNDNLYTGTVTTTFTSSNPSVATVNSTTGLVTGVSVGTSVITGTAVSGNTTATDTATVTVTAGASATTPTQTTTTPTQTVPTQTQVTTPTQTTPVTTVTTPTTTTPPITTTSSSIQWGAYVGDGANAVSAFDTLVGKKSEIIDDFEDFTVPFPTELSSTVGSQGKTLLVFWEPSTGLSTIANGSLDTEIENFAAGAKSYGYPVILVPFDEMNLNESAWGAGVNGNTPAIFISAFRHIHDLFVSAGATNVKFAVDYNNVSIPSSTYASYYPGDAYVDIVGIDGYNFGNPWQTFDQVFSAAYNEASQFNKPIYFMAMASAEGSQKAAWIDSLGTLGANYPKVAGWTWFNVDKEQDWLVNSDAAALAAFKSILP